MNISAALGDSTREFNLTAGEADYILYADGRAFGLFSLRSVVHRERSPQKITGSLICSPEWYTYVGLPVGGNDMRPKPCNMSHQCSLPAAASTSRPPSVF